MSDRRSSFGIRLDDGTFWPAPDAIDRVQWLLRYGTTEQREAVRYEAAEVLNAYSALFLKTIKRRNEVVRRINAVVGADPLPDGES